MAVVLNNPKQAVLLDQARVMRIVIENNPCKHCAGDNHKYFDVFVVIGREVDGKFIEQMDPENHSIAQYYRLSDGTNPHARPALPGVDPSSDGNPLGKCDNAECLTWHDRGLDAVCPDCGIGTVQPYDGFTRAASAVIPNLLEFYRQATVAFADEPGAQDAFAAGGATLMQALDDFMATPAFTGMAMQNGLYAYETISEVVYSFLISETAPDPDTGESRVLLAAS